MAKKVDPDFGNTAGPALHSARWRFGEFQLDESKRELRRGGELVEIEPKPLNMLMLMLRHPGELITKNDLLEALWPGRIVVEAVLSTCVSRLRTALGPEMGAALKTVSGFGYRFDVVAELLPDEKAAVAAPRLDFNVGDQFPNRPNWKLVRRLGRSGDSWLAEHVKTRVRRVFKFTSDPRGLSALKREVTIFRLLRDSLGERVCYVEMLDWNFDAPPWFIESEYCPGGSLEEWFESQGGISKVPLAIRLEIIAQVASALAEVHVLGVLHKDLKPANVLVVLGENNQPEIRLADFGSGKLMDSDRLAALEITKMGFTQHIDFNDANSGTPLYLAPEVVSGQPATVKADIYALGVMLYQCVVGNLRRQLSSGWEQEIGDELLREDIAEATDGNPERRLADAAVLARNLRRLEQRRTEREAERAAVVKAEQAARALDRMRARRIGMRVAFAAITVGFAISALLYADARKARNVAEAETQRAEKVAAFLGQDMFKAVTTDAHSVKDVTVRDLLQSASKAVDVRFHDEPDIAARLYRSLGEGYQALDDWPAAQPNLDLALDLYERIDPASSETLDVASETILFDFVKGTLPTRIARYEAIEAAGQSRLGVGAPQVNRLSIAIARAHIQLGEWLRGEKELKSILESIQNRNAPELELEITAELALGYIETDLAQYSDAENHLKDVLNKIGTHRGSGHRDEARARLELGQLFALIGKFKESEQELSSALSIVEKWVDNDSGYIFGIRLYQGLLKYEMGDASGAVDILEPLLRDYEASLGGTMNQSYVQRQPLARAYLALGRVVDAEKMMRSALFGSMSALDEQHPYNISIRIGLAGILREEGKTKSAWEVLNREPKITLEGFPIDHPIRAELSRTLGLLWRDAGDLEKSKQSLSNAANIYTAKFGVSHRLTSKVNEELNAKLGVVQSLATLNVLKQ